MEETSSNASQGRKQQEPNPESAEDNKDQSRSESETKTITPGVNEKTEVLRRQTSRNP